MKKYTINQCGVVIDADTAIEIKGKDYLFKLRTAEKNGRIAYGTDYMRSDYGSCSPVSFNYDLYDTYADMAKKVISRLKEQRGRSNYPKHIVDEIINAIRDKYFQLNLFE